MLKMLNTLRNLNIFYFNEHNVHKAKWNPKTDQNCSKCTLPSLRQNKQTPRVPRGWNIVNNQG
jgi:hypothetical protein